jgi:methionyl aminopeptidase
LDAEARTFIDGLGGRPAFLGYHGFPAALCTSVNDQVIHGIPNGRRLRSGDVLGIDCGIEYNGYYSDAAFSVALGTVAPEVRKLMEVTRECLYRGIEAARVGNRIKDISRAVYSHAKEHGYGVVRQYCGHGVGLDIHEEPQVPNYVGRGNNPRLKPGMVLAIEPMINLGTDDVEVLDDDWTVVTADGSVSAHFEHSVAILDDRTEVLTDW